MGLNVTHRGRTAIEQFNKGVEMHKARYNTLPYRITLSADWQDEMQHATALVVEGQEVKVGLG